MRYMLDTNIISFLMRRQPGVTARLAGVGVEQVCISAVTAGEVYYGLAKRPSESRTRAVSQLFQLLRVLPWDDRVAVTYGQVRAQLVAQGQPLGPLDMQIAAHALAEDTIIVTNDQAFARVPGLRMEDWS